MTVKYIASHTWTPHSFLSLSGEDIAFHLTVKLKELKENVFISFHNLSNQPGFIGPISLDSDFLPINVNFIPVSVNE